MKILIDLSTLKTILQSEGELTELTIQQQRDLYRKITTEPTIEFCTDVAKVLVIKENIGLKNYGLETMLEAVKQIEFAAELRLNRLQSIHDLFYEKMESDPKFEMLINSIK